MPYRWLVGSLARRRRSLSSSSSSSSSLSWPGRSSRQLLPTTTTTSSFCGSRYCYLSSSSSSSTSTSTSTSTSSSSSSSKTTPGTTNNNNNNNNSSNQQQQQRQVRGENLRVAVVGGGAAGLSTALHLAPLVESGCIASPIDVFDAQGGNTSREIGVGIWSTALDPFQKSKRTSHDMVYNEMTSKGTWLGDVGYRTPNGNWLMKSHLPTSREECEKTGMPALLFLREKDMLTSLQKAVHWEEHQGNIQLHRDGNKTRVCRLQEDSNQCWSTKLVFGDQEQSCRLSDRDYHLIIAADGTHSVLREMYGGHDAARRILTGTAALPSPIELPQQQDESSSDTTTTTTTSSSSSSSWTESQQQRAVGLQDRNYTVFRGNAPLTRADLGLQEDDDDDVDDANNSTSFQTWGEGRSMRFAAVPMFYPGKQKTTEERQVWFITIDDDSIASESDPSKRRAMLLKAFQDWHDPVCRMVEATPPEEILMERAIAHRHSMGPVLNFNKVVKQMRGKRPPSSGEGPCIVFVGDANMTVDPILAQGFTVAMEGAANLRQAIAPCCVPFSNDPSFAFDPYILRSQLLKRHEEKLGRLICLLRVTELVQALGQPTGGTLFLNTKVLRPLTRLTPNFIKAPLFDAVLKYSLGLFGKR